MPRMAQDGHARIIWVETQRLPFLGYLLEVGSGADPSPNLPVVPSETLQRARAGCPEPLARRGFHYAECFEDFQTLAGLSPFQTSPSRRAPARLRAAPRRRRRLRRPGGSTWSSTGLHPSAIAEEGLLDESRGVRAVDQGMTDLHARLPLAPAVVRVSVRLAAVSRPQRCRGHAFCVFRSGKVGIPATKVDRWQSCFPPFQKV